MKLNRKLHIPLYIQLKDQILIEIKSDQYAIGDCIPSEQDMMKSYQVGRATVREAINELVKEGFLEKHQGRGTFIRRKDTSLGFEPLISLSYSLGLRGWNHRNDILERREIQNSEEVKQMSLIQSTKSLLLKRSRFIDQHPIGLETFYFHEAFIELSKLHRLEHSIGKLLLETLKLPVERMVQEVVVVKATEEEAKILKIHDNADVMWMKRWLYIRGYEGAYQYYELKVPVGVSAFPAEFL